MALPCQGFHPQSAGCLVGSEGGAVFRCTLDGSRSALQAFAQVHVTMPPATPLSAGGVSESAKGAVCLGFCTQS